MRAASPEGASDWSRTPDSFISVSAGYYHSCGVRADRTVACWGEDWRGLVTGSPAGSFESVSSAWLDSCALKSDGTVECWGNNAFGHAPAPTGTFSAVSAGNQHACGVRADGTVECWGRNRRGEASPPEGSFVSVSAGDQHTCGVRADGTAACWGDDFSGQSSPPPGTFASVSAGHEHTCGVRADGTAACWGFDGGGESSAPSGSFSSVSAGGRYSCGVKTDGAVLCWGQNPHGEATPPEGRFSSVSAGAGGAASAGHTCGIRIDGRVECWGNDDHGKATPPAAATTTATTAGAVNRAPRFTSPAALDATENTTSIGTVTAVDDDGADSVVGYTISGGADQRAFRMDNRGALTFTTAPDYERPSDADDDGVYEVVVTAASGGRGREQTADMAVTATVLDDDAEAPAAPGRPAVRSVTADTVTLSWDAPANTGPEVDDYDVRYRAIGAADWTEWPHTGTALTTTITGLAADTAYEFQVRAGNAEGTGDWSPGANTTTGAGGNSAPRFTSDAVFSVRENQAAVGVVAAVDDDGDRVRGYSISGGADRARFVIDSSGALRFVAAPDYERPSSSGRANAYLVVVTAASGTGARARHATQTVTVDVTDSDEPPSAPANPTVSAITRNSLTLAWTAPATTGPAVTGYDVRYRDVSHGAWTDRAHTGTGRTATIRGLSADTTYELQVRASNPEGAGPWSSEPLKLSSLSVGVDHSCGLTADAAVVCWGADGSGQASPPPGAFASVSAGGNHSCGLTADGAVACWGDNDSGQATPPSGPFTAVSAGYDHSCAVDSTGVIACWGDDDSGQASPPSGTFTAVSAGWAHSCGLTTDSTIACWGDNDSRQASPPSGSFTAVSAGGSHSCGLRTNGTVACWGENSSRQASPPSGSFTAVSAGGSHSCGLRTNNTVACWGDNGNGEATPPSGPFTAVSAGSDYSCGLAAGGSVVCWGYNGDERADAPDGSFAAVSAGFLHSCGTQPGGTVTCWGDNGDGQSSPPPGTFSSVSAGDYHSCGLTADGAVECWGSDGDGQSSPPPGTFSSVSAGGNHSCGLTADGAVECWGSDGDGQSSPPLGPFTAVSAGFLHSCGTQPGGTVTCWGDNGDGQSSPPPGTFSSVSAGDYHSCGLTASSAVECWGSDGDGQSSPPPGTFSSVSAGGNHSCGLRTNNTVACWGDNDSGQSSPPSGSFSSVSASVWHSCATRADQSVVCWGYNGDERATSPATSTVATTAGNQPPSFTTIGFVEDRVDETVEYAENTDEGFFLVAGDDERDAITGYSVTGADAALFEVYHEDGYSVVAFATPPDYEHPSDDGAGNDYELAVTATGGVGERALSVTRTVTVRVTDDDTEAPHPPFDPAVASVTETSVTFEWDEPHNEGPAIDDYDIRYREAGATTWVDWPHTGTARTATITGLSQGTAYELQVLAGNDEGISDWSLSPLARPGEGASVTMGRANWTSGYFQAEVYAALLRELGYAVSDPADLEQGPGTAYAAMAGGAMDFWANSWYPAHEIWLDDVLDDGSRVGDQVSAIGYQMIAGGLEGIVITKSFADDYGVYTLEDLDSNADAIAAYDAADEVPGNGKADVYGCQQAWLCDDVIDAHLALGGYQNIQQVTGDYDEMHASALARGRGRAARGGVRVDAVEVHHAAAARRQRVLARHRGDPGQPAARHRGRGRRPVPRGPRSR